MPDLSAPLARLRVPIGFAASVAALLLARPTWTSVAWGLVLAATGEAIRFWAAGHLEKGREVTSSGPYRFTGHPLYLGSTLLGAGFAVASNSVIVAVMAVFYLGLTLGAAIRSEEAGLRAKFGREYEEYRSGRGAGQARRFSLDRAVRNREHRAVAGVVGVMILLSLKTWLLL
jgi:protein-S-isoprenylcysteine O-methyltransferase Ste14